MFPTLSHLIQYFTGIYIPLPIYTFGLFVGLAFYAAYTAFKWELIRKEQTSLLLPSTQTQRIGEGPSLWETALNAGIGFIIGFKLVYAIFHYRQFVVNPADLLISTEGSWIGGGILAILFGRWIYQDKKKRQLPEVREVQVQVQPHEQMGQILIRAAIWGLLGAKIFHNLEYWDEFMQAPLENLFSFSGLTFYGGIIFGGTAVLYYTRKLGIPIAHMLDVSAPGMMLGYAIGRLGCHLSGDGDWGIPVTHLKPTWLSWLPDWIWAFKFPHNVIQEGVPIAGCTGRFCRELPIAVYPTSFYEFLGCLLLFAVLWFGRKKIHIPGMLFSIYLIFNGVERFLIELIRVNSKYHVAGIAFTQAELISSILILSGLAGVLLSKSRTKNRSTL